MRMTEPELVADCDALVGEGPLWHAQSKTLWFTDIEGRKLLRYDPATGKWDTIRTSKGRVGGFTFERDGSAVLFEEQQVIHLANDGAERVLCEIREGNRERFNDVKADPEGRVLVGTMGVEKNDGALIRVERGGKHTILMSAVGIGNGPCFSTDGKQLYFTDSKAQKIYVFDYDRTTGNLGNPRLFLDVPKEEGLPDGATVDAEGYYWSTRWGGSQAVRYRTDGSVERRVTLPAKQITSMTFGGPDYTDIYFTSGTYGLQDLPKPQRGGGLYHLNLGIKGIPEPASRLVV